MPLLTIYTPTYNREKLLPRVYDCLCRQTCRDFLWLVVDDGSTDYTRELVAGWIAEGKLAIQYLYKENGGVHTARDLAYHSCTTELITSCDSDDWLTDDAVEQIATCWKEQGGDEYAGIFNATQDRNGNRVCGEFPKEKATTYQDFTYKYRCNGDKHTVLRADIIAAIPDAPVFEGEKLVGEGFKWIQLPEDKPFLLLDEPISIVEYQQAGISRAVAENRFKNPNGFRANYRQLIISSKYLRPRIKGHLGYIAFSLILKDRSFIRNSPKPLVTSLLLPFGIAVYFRFLQQRNKVTK